MHHVDRNDVPTMVALQRAATSMADGYSLPWPCERPQRHGPFTTGYLAFPNHLAVGGTADVTLFRTGSYLARVQLHNASFASYDVRLVWMCKTASGDGYALPVLGHIAGRIEAGSRDVDWILSGENQSLAERWDDLAGSRSQRWEASVTLDIAQLIERNRVLLGVTGSVARLA